MSARMHATVGRRLKKARAGIAKNLRKRVGLGRLRPSLIYHAYKRLDTEFSISLTNTVVSGINVVSEGTNVANQIAFSAITAEAGTAQNASQFGAAIWFQLQNVEGYAELTALYDQYRVDYVEVKFFGSNMGPIGGNPNALLPLMYIAKDYDDANVPASVDTVSQYSNVKTVRLSSMKPYVVKLVPRWAQTIYTTPFGTGYGQGNPKQFLDASNANIQMYGLKVWFRDWSNLQSYAETVRVQASYYLTMKNTR